MTSTIKEFVMPNDEATKINSKIPLLWTGIVFALYGCFMLFNPLGLLSQYGIEVSGISQGDTMMVSGLLLQWGTMYIMIAGMCSIACRVGTEKTRMHLNLAVAASSLLNIMLLATGFTSLVEAGATWGGLLFNTCLYGFTAILAVLGAGVSFQVVPYKQLMYWGSMAMAALYFAYSAMMLFMPVQLFHGYQVTIQSVMVHKLVLTLVQYGFSGVFFTIGAFLLTGMMTADFMYTYTLNRWLAMIQLGMFFAGAYSAAWWSTKNYDGRLDDFMLGQWINCGYWLAFFVLTYAPVANLDTQVAQSVRQAIGGQFKGDESLTLLSPGGSKKASLVDEKKAPLLET
jgi:hypothetical protein